MATFGEIEDNIASLLNRTDLSSSIQLAIKTAIKHYEGEAFDFNEDTFTRTLSSGASVYTLTGSMSLITQFINVKVTVNGTDMELRPESYQYLEKIDTDGSSGEPSIYSVFGNTIRVYPKPSGNYTLTARCNRKYSTLSASTDSNAWTINAEDLIQARAMYWLSMTKKRDFQMAQQTKAIESQAYDSLVNKSTLKTSSGKINPTRF